MIVTTAERARDLKKPPVYISGMQGLPGGHEEFIWAYPGFGVAQQSVFEYEAGLQPVYKMAGITPNDVDALFTYDAFSILAWIALERFGFCKTGEAAAFTQDWRIEVGGELPMNTNGGLALRSAHHGLEPSGRNRAAIARRMRPAPGQGLRDYPVGECVWRLAHLSQMTIIISSYCEH